MKSNLKLYPPILPTNLPSGVINELDNWSLSIPFTLNPTVYYDEVKEIAYQIRSMSGQLLYTGYCPVPTDNILKITSFSNVRLGDVTLDNEVDNLDAALILKYDAGLADLTDQQLRKGDATLDNTVDNLDAALILKYDAGLVDLKREKPFFSFLSYGQYYKIQIACVDYNNIVGYWSTVAYFKNAGKLRVTIDGLKQNGIAYLRQSFVGRYVHSDDPSEKMATYCFTVYDNDGNIIETTGEQVHNNLDDKKPDESINTFSLSELPIEDQECKIQYVITTVSGLQSESPLYRLSFQNMLTSEYQNYIQLTTTFDQENGFIKIGWKTLDNNNQSIVGSFKILRADDLDQYATWHEIGRLNVINATVDILSFKDFTVENGRWYKYALQQYQEQHNLATQLFGYSIPQFVDLEYSFLSDNTRQLCIKYNTTINSFKTVLMENKVDTIGNQFPHFFRNGVVDYKEFEIDGLISRLTDKDSYFCSQSTSYGDISPTDPSAENYALEQQFKMQVLDWLNNGKVKLFRSAAEGSFFVRLFNISLTPQEDLNRLLYTFSATATEVEEFNFANLKKNGFFKHNSYDNTQDNTTNLMWRSLTYEQIIERKNRNLLTKKLKVYGIRLEDFEEGDKFDIDGTQVIINSTGNYYYEHPVKSIKYLGNISKTIRNLPGDSAEKGILIYYTEPYELSTFRQITNIEAEIISLQQFLGSSLDIDDSGYSSNLLSKTEYISAGIKYNYAIKYLRAYVDTFLSSGLSSKTSIKVQTVDMAEPAVIELDRDPQAVIEEFNDLDLDVRYVQYYYELLNINDLVLIQVGDSAVVEISYFLTEKSYEIEQEHPWTTLQEKIDTITQIKNSLKTGNLSTYYVGEGDGEGKKPYLSEFIGWIDKNTDDLEKLCVGEAIDIIHDFVNGGGGSTPDLQVSPFITTSENIKGDLQNALKNKCVQIKLLWLPDTLTFIQNIDYWKGLLTDLSNFLEDLYIDSLYAKLSWDYTINS